MSIKNSVSPTVPNNGQDSALTVPSLVEKYELTVENEQIANTAMLALIAQANLSGQPIQKDYVERLSGFFQKYQDLVKDLQKMAETNN